MPPSEIGLVLAEVRRAVIAVFPLPVLYLGSQSVGRHRMILNVDKAVGAKIRGCYVTLTQQLRHAAGPGAYITRCSAHLKSLRHMHDVPSLAPLGVFVGLL